MKSVHPRVYLIARPQLIGDEISMYLERQGANQWLDRNLEHIYDHGADTSYLTEIAGRICYRSWEPGLNPNVTKVRQNQADYLHNIIKVKHGNLLRHAQFSFIFENMSRVAVMELLRHQVGTAPSQQEHDTHTEEPLSQESMRYVRISDIEFYESPVLDEEDHSRERMLIHMVEDYIRLTSAKYHLDESQEGPDFHTKKAITSAMRRVIPQGIATDMVWSANLQTIRYILQARTSMAAEEEIRNIFHQVGLALLPYCGAILDDFTISPDGEWTTPYEKV